jgi:hypothetical protein
MLVRRKGSAMSAPATPHPSLPPTPLRILASPKSTVPGVVDSLVVGAAGCLVAKLQAAAATASAHTCAGADSDILSSQVFHVARLLRYKVYLLQQVRPKLHIFLYAQPVICNLRSCILCQAL